VGDPHQRIYDSRVSLAATGINVRGRSRRLTVNYRTTQEILTWALPALGTAPAVGLDDRDDTLAGYRSLLHGHKPTVRWYATDAEEMAGLTDRVRSWIGSGIEPHAIAVAGRSGHLVRKAAGALRSAGIDQVMIGDGEAAEPDAVRIGTMHRMKGLEFQAVAVIGVGAGMVPAAAAVTYADDDPVAHKHDLQRERCLLFVACTRARDHLYLSYTGEPSPFLTVVR
jgi:superfamily I DNA/RNA helicase